MSAHVEHTKSDPVPICNHPPDRSNKPYRFRPNCLFDPLIVRWFMIWIQPDKLRHSECSHGWCQPTFLTHKCAQLINIVMYTHGSFLVWAQPMRDDVTMWRHLLLPEPIPRMLGMGPTNARRRYNVTSSLTGWTHTQHDPYIQRNLRRDSSYNSPEWVHYFLPLE